MQYRWRFFILVLFAIITLIILWPYLEKWSTPKTTNAQAVLATDWDGLADSELSDIRPLDPIDMPEIGSAGSHCVVELNTSEVISSKCGFGSIEDALTYILDQTDSRTVTVDEILTLITNAQNGESASVAMVILAIMYDKTGFEGASLTFWTSNTNGCSNGTTYVLPSMPSGWNNEGSSGIGISCNRNFYYDLFNLAGVNYECYGACGTFGPMNERPSSARFTDW